MNPEQRSPQPRRGSTADSLPDRLRREEGANLVEMALVTVMLLLIMAVTVDGAGAFRDFIVITNAAREGARTGAKLPCRNDNRGPLRAAILAATIDEAAGSNVALTADDIAIDPDPVTACTTPGEPIRVTVTIQYAAQLGGLLGVPLFPIRSSAAMAYNGAF